MMEVYFLVKTLWMILGIITLIGCTVYEIWRRR